MNRHRAFHKMWPMGLILFLAAGGGFWVSPWLGLPLLVLFCYHLSFFRDPERSAPSDPKAIVAPADGKVLEIKRLGEEWFQRRETNRIAIFLSIFNVHVNRAPIGGEVKFHQHFPGQFFDARHPASSAVNESQVIGITDGDYAVTVKLIAGKIARRIVNWCAVGDRLTRGERIGMIRYGSRVELFLPLEARIAVKVGEQVKGGASIIAWKQ